MFFASAIFSSVILWRSGLAQSQQPSPFCPEPDGDFPNPASESCTAFFRCTQGKPLSRRCPNGERFDFLLRTCGPRDEVNCERQLQLFASDSTATSSNWPYSGLGFPSLFPGFYDQQFYQGTLDQQNPAAGQNAFTGQQRGLNQGNVGQLPSQRNQGAAVNPQNQQAQAGQNSNPQGLSASDITIASNGAVLSNGRQIGWVYYTDQGTVIVLSKQRGQQQTQTPNVPVFTIPATAFNTGVQQNAIAANTGVQQNAVAANTGVQQNAVAANTGVQQNAAQQPTVVTVGGQQQLVVQHPVANQQPQNSQLVQSNLPAQLSTQADQGGNEPIPSHSTSKYSSAANVKQ